MLITTSAMSGVMMAPGEMNWTTLGACALGTALMSASANSFNHLLEAPYDAQMKRTQTRVLVTHRFSPLHALTFAGVTSATGLGVLCTGMVCYILWHTFNMSFYVLLWCPYGQQECYCLF